MTLNLKIILGSTRPGRKAPIVGRWVEEAARAHGGFDVDLVDLAEMGLPLLDEAEHPARQAYAHPHTRAWSEIVDSADAFIFVMPEYDSFPPAALVNAIQVLLREWGRKPAGIVSYGGVSGGLRGGLVLRQLLGAVGMMPLAAGVPLPFFANHIEDGTFIPTEPMIEGAGRMFDELASWGQTLQPMRAA